MAGVWRPGCAIDFTITGEITAVVLANNNGDFEWTMSDFDLGEYRLTAIGHNGKGYYAIPTDGGNSTKWIRVVEKTPIKIRGVADPGSSVEITLAGSMTATTTANQDGDFALSLNDVRRAHYQISAKTEGADADQPATAEQTVNYQAIVRRLTIFVSFKNLMVNCDVVLPKNDPSAKALENGSLNLSEFITNVFGGSINGNDINRLFLPLKPQITNVADIL